MLCSKTRIPEGYLNKHNEIDIVFVSPLNRTLQTAEIMMDANRLKVRKVIVLPQLSEVLSKICDFGGCLKEKKEKYKHYDFGEISRFMKQRKSLKDEGHWQDPFVDRQHRQLISHGEKNGHRYLKILENIFPIPLENSERCFRRAMRALQRMKEIVEECKAQKVVVVSHNRILKYIDGRFSKGRARSFENCEIRQLIF